MIIIEIDDKMSSSMDISETFRPEDLSKTDFFDFVTAPDMGIGIGGIQDRPPGNTQDTTNGQNDQSLQGYDQFWSTDKDPNRLDAAIFEDLDRYCWQQQHQQQQTHQSNQHHHHQQQQQSSQHQTSSSTSTNPSSVVSSINHQSSIVAVGSTNVGNGSTNNNGNGNNSNGGVSSGGGGGGGVGVNGGGIIGNGGGNNGVGNTDGQIYTLTVLNGNESWLKRDPDNTGAPTLDLDSILGNFPAYVKSEFPYDDSSFSTDNSIKDELGQQSQQQQQQQHTQQGPIGIPVTTVVTTTSTNLAQFQNNNNDWQMADNNTTEQNSAESLLRSALQGKGYSKGLHLQNGVTLLPNQNPLKDEELRRALFSTEQENLTFADSALSAPIYDDTQGGIVTSPVVTHHQSQASQQPQSIITAPAGSNCNTNNTNTNHSTTTAGIIVDDMFLSLETAFTDDFEKIKRIANEVQQFCTSNDYPEVIMEITAAVPHASQPIQVQPPPQPPPPPPPQPLQPEVTTSSPVPTSSITKTTAKKYKRSTINNNNNTNNNNNNTSLANNNNNNSPTHCNGQRKERSLHYCSICSKGFKDKYSVNVHIRTHTGEKPFACSLCGKSFRQKAHLAKHYQTHLAQKNNGNVVKGGKSQSSSNRSTTGQQQIISSQASSRSQVSPNNTNTGPSLPPANGLLANR